MPGSLDNRKRETTEMGIAQEREHPLNGAGTPNSLGSRTRGEQGLTSVNFCITKLLDAQRARLNLW